MSAEVFLDTNIFLYASSSASGDAPKQAVANRLILEADFAISTQVLQEFIANALRKKSLGISEQGIDALLELSSQVEVLPLSLELVMQATIFRRRYQLSHWDASILAAAHTLGCETLYTEDLNNGQDYAGVRAVNPFEGL